MDEKAIIQALRNLTSDPTALALLDRLIQARKETYKRICIAADNEICGDILQIQPGNPNIVIAVGTDAIKNIVFEQMGFEPEDALELG